jgi:sortase A
MSKRGKICTGIGLLLLAAALFLTAYNLWSDAKAGKTADTVLEQLKPELETAEEKAEISLPALPSGESLEEAYIPDYILNPEMEMPVEEVDGQKYIGVLRIPALSLELPVISEWSYPSLQIAPCRYAGSVYLNNMVIAAHNYYSHFGYLKKLSQGDEITFTDTDGNVFRYEVITLETLSPFAIEEMTSGDWDLTLFTCTVGGQSRVTVRCQLTEDGD